MYMLRIGLQEACEKVGEQVWEVVKVGKDQPACYCTADLLLLFWW